MTDVYDVLKTQKDKIMFKILTGVSMIPVIRYLSQINDWRNLSINHIYSTMLGFTRKEMVNCFDDCHFWELCSSISRENNKPMPTDNKEIKTMAMEKPTYWYNGYRFSEKKKTVFNPLSIITCFDYSKLGSDWSTTVQSNFLWNELLENPDVYKDMQKNDSILVEESAISCNSEDCTKMPARAYTVAYQDGLLTIKDVEKIDGKKWYQLGIPNTEVRENSAKAVRSAMEKNLKILNTKKNLRKW